VITHRRAFRVYPGNCNATIGHALADLRPYAWAPTFAFIDPDGPHVHWATLDALAHHRSGRYKTEFWLLLPHGLFMRVLPVDGSPVTPATEAMLTAMFGTDHWKRI
jgi:three-Cys-motif partner protein